MEKTLKDYSKGSRYVVLTDNVTYWRKNVKSAVELVSFLEDEKIDYVVLKIEDANFYNKKNNR